MKTTCERSGVMLDAGRKYYSPAEIKKLINLIADCGLGTLMLHYSEDAGYGIESKAFPFLPGRDGALCTQTAEGPLASDMRYLSADEIGEIVSFARSKGVQVVPSFDSPGHLNYSVAKFHEQVKELGAFEFTCAGSVCRAEYDGGYRFFIDGSETGSVGSREYGIGSYFSLDGKTSRVCGTGNHAFSRGVDLSNPAAVLFAEALLRDSSEIFRNLGCDEIDIGGDELLGFAPAITADLPKWMQLDSWRRRAAELSGLPDAVPYDMFVIYMNRICRAMFDEGFSCVRVWNDEFMRESDTGWKYGDPGHVQFDPRFTVQYWSAKPAFAPVASIAARGHDIIGADSEYCYYVLISKARSDPPEAYRKCVASAVEAEWDRYSFGSGILEGSRLDTPELRARLKGNVVCVWSDRSDLRTGEEVLCELEPLLRTAAKKIRGS